MFRSLVNEMVQRKLWPIPLIAVLVAIAVPLLFMDKSSGGASRTDLTPAPVQKSGDLPADAGALLSTDERVERVRRPGQDPFDRPASVEQKARSEAAAAKQAPGAAKPSASARKAIKKIVESLQGGSTGPSSRAPNTITTTPKSITAAPRDTTSAAPKKRTTPKLSPISSRRIRMASVTVRYGATKDAPVQRTIPQRKVFQADGEAIAVFIRYSGKRDRAMFAIAPGVSVSGSVDCEIVDGVCRYLAIPDGGYARLSYRRADGTQISRRLDVAIETIIARAKPELSAAKLQQGNCVLDKLLSLPSGSLALPLERCS